MSVFVYHGGTKIIEHPQVDVGRDNLDFGKGFYLADHRPNNQMCILNQDIIDKYLKYNGTV